MAKIIAISLPEELIPVMDEAAKALYATRSEYIRQAVLARLRQDQKLDMAAGDRDRMRRLKDYLKAQQ